MMGLLFTSMVLFAVKMVVQATDCLNVAQTEIPSCAQSCFLENASSVGCGGLDFNCQCQNEATLYAAIEPCVASGCPESSFQDVIDGASSVCNCATAVPRALAVGSSLGSFVGAATVTGSGTVPATVVGTVSSLVSGTVTVASNPTGTSTISASATSSTSQSGSLSYQGDLGSSFTSMVVLLMLCTLLF
ncbi:hypothetical protein F4781DRAFT_248739 [Annulohypoxylon bovei var. microspora]|nr:hypothetical protein F4781DRAFT_248739 [Annulohypoxylon bovei var. microspora]